jgi:hypothetical protein
MTSRDFCYWLQGFFEIGQTDAGVGLTGHQKDIIARHLAMVFKHEIDPSMGGPDKQAILNNVHNGIGTTGNPDADVKYRC